MKAKFLIIFFILTNYLNIHAQDTITRKGLIIIQCDGLPNTIELQEGMRSSLPFHPLMGMFIEIDSNSVISNLECNKMYFKFIKKGVYITSDWFPKYADSMVLRDEFKNINTKIGKDVVINNSINALNLFPTGKFWKHINNGQVMFYVFQCEFKCIFLKQIKLSIPNIKANNKRQAYIHYQPNVFLITEILSMKPISKCFN